ncbi:MAG: VanZ family protein [Propionivibrio sp.]
MLRNESIQGNSARLISIAATLYLVFVFYGSWVPLKFRPMPIADAWLAFRSLPFLEQSIQSATDWATNFLLLIPLTFMLAQRIVSPHTGTARTVLRVLIAGFGVLIACTLEFSQLFFLQRTVSQKDILAMSLGGMLGVIAQYRWGNPFENWLQAIWQKESRQDRVARMLYAYLAILVLFNLLPLDLTISIVEIYHKWREGRVILLPFAGSKGGTFDVLYELSTDIAIWIPVGVFWVLGRQSSLLRAIFAGLAMATAIESAQLFVFSRVTDVTDILLAGAGAGLGGWVALVRGKSANPVADAPARFWLTLWGVWCIGVLGVFWFPFDFRYAGASLDSAVASFTRIPFLLLYQSSEYHAANEMLRKIGFFLPGGILWGLATAARGQVENNRSFGRTVIVAHLFIAFVVEAGQLFIPGKVADLTDVFLQTSGGMLGWVLITWIMAGERRPDSGLRRNDGSLASHHEIASRYDESKEPGTTRHTGLDPKSKGAPMDSGFHRNDRSAGTPLRGRQPGLREWKKHLAIFCVLLVGVALLTRLSFMPYNIRELNHGGIAGVFSSLGLTCAIYWIANGHFLFVRWAGQARALWLPAWLLVHAGIAWSLLRGSVPMESIHDIVGSPVLNWPGEWELTGRYIALHSVIALAGLGAILLLRLLRWQTGLTTLVVWLMCCLVLAWPLHWAIVEQAATDNLTELMRGGGNFANSLLLATGSLALFVTGSSIGAILSGSRKVLFLLTIAFVASCMATTAFWFGSEHLILKYGKLFSAWQFLLSTDRQHLSSGMALMMRYTLAYSVVAAAIGFLQSSWMKHPHSVDRP